MTQADSVLSTPRRTASKIRAKKIAKPARAEGSDPRDLHHAEAFRDLETPIHELFCMSEITDNITGVIHKDKSEFMCFAIYRLGDMIRDLRAKYKAAYDATPGRGKTVA
jgi:hypothetical protein